MRDRSGLANNKMEFSARNMGRKKALLQEDMTLEHNTENTANDDLEKLPLGKTNRQQRSTYHRGGKGPLLLFQ